METIEAPESSTVRYTAVLKDVDGTVIPSAIVSTITATLYLEDTAGNTIISGWNARDIFNANDCTFGISDGLITIFLGPSDTAMTDTTKQRERLICEYVFAYGSGPQKTGRHRFRVILENYGSV